MRKECVERARMSGTQGETRVSVERSTGARQDVQRMRAARCARSNPCRWLVLATGTAGPPPPNRPPRAALPTHAHPTHTRGMHPLVCKEFLVQSIGIVLVVQSMRIGGECTSEFRIATVVEWMRVPCSGKGMGMHAWGNGEILQLELRAVVLGWGPHLEGGYQRKDQ